MEKQTKKSFLMIASEVELITMPIETILNEVAEHYNDLQNKAQRGEIQSKVAAELDTRLAHASILFEEGKRLNASYPTLAKHLFAASIYWQEQRGLAYFTEAERKALFDKVAEIERKREEKRKKAMKK